MIGKISREKINEWLSGSLPGKEAQERMSPKNRHDFECRDDLREAAVLLLFYPDRGDTRLVFMKRNEYDGPHSGQISFPGGMRELRDKDLVVTALRENEEETGVPADSVEVLGKLTPLHIPVSNFCVHPFVGWTREVPQFDPDETEVQYLICPELREIFDPANRKSGTFHRHGVTLETPYFDIDGEMIWGATAMILNEFMVLTGYC